MVHLEPENSIEFDLGRSRICSCVEQRETQHTLLSIYVLVSAKSIAIDIYQKCQGNLYLDLVMIDYPLSTIH
jgi:hypothetical protein